MLPVALCSALPRAPQELLSGCICTYERILIRTLKLVLQTIKLIFLLQLLLLSSHSRRMDHCFLSEKTWCLLGVLWYVHRHFPSRPPERDIISRSWKFNYIPACMSPLVRLLLLLQIINLIRPGPLSFVLRVASSAGRFQLFELGKFNVEICYT